MPASSSAQVHPTAILSPEVELGDGVQIGPYTIIEGAVKLGDGCKVGPHCQFIGPISAGKNNSFGAGCVVGESPQHLGYRGEPSRVEIGENNTFREYVTIHRGSHMRGVTSIGNHNYLMVNCHIAHDCIIANHCIIANGALVAGHCELDDRVFLSGNTAIHQFVRMGRLSLVSGCEATSKDVPPFMVVVTRSIIGSVNIIGMRRSGMGLSEIQAVKKAFNILYRSELTVREAVERIDSELSESSAIQEILKFIKSSKRGIGLSPNSQLVESEE